MPCACLIPLPNYPTNESWGPILWRVLHGLAEKYGKLITPLFHQEEVLAWTHLIDNTYKILPCKDCRDHYLKWLKKIQ